MLFAYSCTSKLISHLCLLLSLSLWKYFYKYYFTCSALFAAINCLRDRLILEEQAVLNFLKVLLQETTAQNFSKIVTAIGVKK